MLHRPYFLFYPVRAKSRGQRKNRILNKIAIIFLIRWLFYGEKRKTTVLPYLTLQLTKMKNILNQTNGFIYFLLYFGAAVALVIYVLYTQSIVFNISSEALILLSSSVPFKPGEEKPKWLCKEERAQFTLPSELKDILIGLCLGDLNIQKEYANARLRFVQGALHKEYLEHLYKLFSSYCSRVPKTSSGAPDKRTGVKHSSIRFETFSLPCFNELHKLFYFEGKKIVPLTIAELLTPLGLVYWLCDDGTRNQKCGYVELCTNSFSLAGVELLVNALNSKWDLKCYKSKRGDSYTIRIPAYSVPILPDLLKDIMPSMMRYKIGL